MKYRILVKTVVVSETGNLSVVQDVVEFDNYSEANEAVASIESTNKVYLELMQSAGQTVSKTTAIRLYKYN
jgi:hypothetical protein